MLQERSSSIADTAVPPTTASQPAESSGTRPVFRPAAGCRNPHVQTLLGTLLSERPAFAATHRRTVRLADGDAVVLHDDRPEQWQPGQPVALLLHGLSGCYESGYMMRIASRLNGLGLRSFRMDHRGCGAAAGLATRPYHAGRIEDLHSAVEYVTELCPQSPIAVAGFSLSGNLLLRYLGDVSFTRSPQLSRAVAVCPPIDLSHCVKTLAQTRMGQRYDWYFTRRLIEQVSDSPQWNEDLPLAQVERLPRGLYGFDDLFTAPASGFASADDYYEFASANTRISQISLPTTVLAAADDPLVSARPWSDLSLPDSVQLCLTEHGGHLGYLSRRGRTGSRRWMDEVVVDWLTD